MENRIATWYGTPIEKLTKEQLIEALEYALFELAKHQTLEARHAYALGKVEVLKGR